MFTLIQISAPSGQPLVFVDTQTHHDAGAVVFFMEHFFALSSVVVQ